MFVVSACRSARLLARFYKFYLGGVGSSQSAALFPRFSIPYPTSVAVTTDVLSRKTFKKSQF
jgi:hypothetical protein